MQGNNLFNNGLLQPKKPPIGQEQQKMTRYHQLRLVFGLVGVLLYPFAILGSIPLLIGLAVDKRDKAANVFDMDYESFLKRNSIVFLSFSAVLFVINVFAFILWIPRGYLSAYLLFPLNLLHTALRFNWETIVALLIGSSGMGAIFLAFSSFVAKRKVISKEDERKKVTESKEYKNRQKNKFEESQRFTDEQEKEYQEAVESVDIDKYKELSNQLLLGMSEFGLSYIMNFSEFNQHALIPATTGSGKTTLLQLLVQHAVKFNFPVILIDGKGARDTLESMREIAKFYDKEVHAFTDDGDMRYNPVDHGNDISIRDKLVSLAETESVFYSGAAKALLQVTIQLLDE
ncbi:helicase HerA domain-containing protein, partial [Enterococcus faecalis]